jgi:hypothetical protein
MSHRENIQRWQDYAKSQGWANPPLDRLLNVIGVRCPPSFFWPPWAVGLILGLLFACIWGIYMSLTAWSDRTFFQIVIPSAVCGIFFGFSLGLFHWYRRRKKPFHSWKHFVDREG